MKKEKYWIFEKGSRSFPRIWR